MTVYDRYVLLAASSLDPRSSTGIWLVNHPWTFEGGLSAGEHMLAQNPMLRSLGTGGTLHSTPVQSTAYFDSPPPPSTFLCGSTFAVACCCCCQFTVRCYQESWNQIQ